MTDWGRSVATKQISEALFKAFGVDHDVDLEVLAADIAQAINVAAIDHINAREAALQKAMMALTEFYNGVHESLRERNEELEAEHKQLHRRLAKQIGQKPSEIRSA